MSIQMALATTISMINLVGIFWNDIVCYVAPALSFMVVIHYSTSSRCLSFPNATSSILKDVSCPVVV